MKRDTISLNEEGRRAFQEALLAWFRTHQRDLPWRRTLDPYAIWIAEIMLQQTQVATVIPYYERFLSRFPTVQALEQAPLEEVLSLWAGLGYYSRARNLHRAAREIVERYGGEMPTDYDAVRSLPGIGRYTAGAILSIAYNQEAPLLDGNVTRVLTRVFALQGDPRSGETHETLWKLAEALIPPGEARNFNQGLMELGALICIPDAPRCEACPLNALCEARRLGRQADLPERRKSPVTEYVEDVSAVIQHDMKVLVARRFPEGRWGGLWEFPRGTRTPEETLGETARRSARETTGCEIEAGSMVAKIKHTVANRRITLYAFEATLLAGEPAPLGYADLLWASLEDLDRLAFSSPQAKIVQALRRHQQRPKQLPL